MKATSKHFGADEGERLFNERYRDENGKLLWDKVREDLKKHGVRIPPDEWQRMLREGPNPRPKKAG